MSMRYLSNLVLALVAGFIVVISQSFGANTVGWLAFAGGITFLVLGILGGVVDHAPAGIALAVATAVLGIWTIVESLVFGGSPVIWVSFGDALGVLGLAIIALTRHELTTERVVHQLEVSAKPQTRDADRKPVAA